MKKDIQDITKYKLIYDNVLVKAVDISTVRSGIIRGKRKEYKPVLGEVVSVGSGRILDTGGMKEMEIKVGDTVLFNKYMSIEYNLGGDDYYLVREEDCVGYLR